LVELSEKLQITSLIVGNAAAFIFIEETLSVLIQSNILKESQVEAIFNNTKQTFLKKTNDILIAAELEQEEQGFFDMVNKGADEMITHLSKIRKWVLPNSEDNF